jgi:hypothetical protein
MNVSMNAPSAGGVGAAGGHRPPPPPGGGGGPMKAASQALGLSEDDLATELQSGKSLSDVAGEQGVSTDDLAAALKQGMPQELAAGRRADAIVTRMLDEKGGPKRPQGPPPGGGGGFPASKLDGSASGVLGSSLTSSQQQTLDHLSSLLGTDSDSLLSSLKSGSNLSDLVSAKGIGSAQLASVLQDGLLVDTRA